MIFNKAKGILKYCGDLGQTAKHQGPGPGCCFILEKSVPFIQQGDLIAIGFERVRPDRLHFSST
jgi:hypothetical protein